MAFNPFIDPSPMAAAMMAQKFPKRSLPSDSLTDDERVERNDRLYKKYLDEQRLARQKGKKLTLNSFAVDIIENDDEFQLARPSIIRILQEMIEANAAAKS